jgi:hypothetical protein
MRTEPDPAVVVGRNWRFDHLLNEDLETVHWISIAQRRPRRPRWLRHGRKEGNTESRSPESVFG